MNTGQLELRYMVLPHPASKRSLLLSQILSHQAQRNFVDLSHKLLTYIITINKNTNNFYLYQQIDPTLAQKNRHHEV